MPEWFNPAFAKYGHAGGGDDLYHRRSSDPDSVALPFCIRPLMLTEVYSLATTSFNVPDSQAVSPRMPPSHSQSTKANPTTFSNAYNASAPPEPYTGYVEVDDFLQDIMKPQMEALF